MNILKNKKIAILGLGNHGGGISSALYAAHNNSSKIGIFDNASKEQLTLMLKKLESITHKIKIEEYSLDSLKNYDIIIKNPAIPRNSQIMLELKKILELSKKNILLETDISVFFKEKSVPSWIVTGTKGKSSVATALSRLLTARYPNTKLCGNITISPLNLLLQNQKVDKLVLELSSFQIGDFELVNNPPYNNFETLILTNILHDHLNYYSNMEKYVYDKLLIFQHTNQDTKTIIPYMQEAIELKNKYIYYTIHNNTVKLLAENCFFHSPIRLPEKLKGSWIDNSGLWSKHSENSEPILETNISQLPHHIPYQNLSIINTCCIANRDNIMLPKTIQSWTENFLIAHRKEIIPTKLKRTFINDSAATIPQAIQLHLFDNYNIRLIAGGTDKNLIPDDFINAIKNNINKNLIAIYLLDGTYTQLCIPLLKKNNIKFYGPFNDLKSALKKSLLESNENDIIMLSPGCASFGMFKNEFDRGDQFRNLVMEFLD